MRYCDAMSADLLAFTVMAFILVGTALVWYVALSFLVTAVRPLVKRFRRWIDRASGAILIVLGIRVATEARPA